MYVPSLKTRVHKSVLAKGNPNHDRLGRFTSASDMASAVVRRYADAMAGYQRMFPNHDRTKALKVAGRIAASAADMDTPEAKEFYKKNPDAARDEISSLKRETMRAGVPLYLLDAAGTELTPEERKRIVNDSFRSYQMTDDYGAHIKIAARSLYATGSVTRKPQSESFIGDESVRQIRELDAANLLYGIEHAPARTIPAWRGEKRETSPKVGDEINDGLLSFSTDPGVAESFGVSQVGGKAATIYKLEGPSQGLFEKDDFFRNGDWSPLDYEREYLTGGKFVVTSVGKTDAGVALVTVQQVAPSRLGQPLAKFNPNHDERGRFATTNQRNTPLGKNVIDAIFHGGASNITDPQTSSPFRRPLPKFNEELERGDAQRLGRDIYLPAFKMIESAIGLDDLETHWRGIDFHVNPNLGEGTMGCVVYDTYWDNKMDANVSWPHTLSIHPSVTRPAEAKMILAHEYGHIVDALLRPDPRSRVESVSVLSSDGYQHDKLLGKIPESPEAVALMRAIGASKTVSTYKSIVDGLGQDPPDGNGYWSNAIAFGGEAEEFAQDHMIVAEHGGKKYLWYKKFGINPGDFKENVKNYYLSPSELFARAFAQYVAVKSGDPDAIAEIAKHAGQITKRDSSLYAEFANRGMHEFELSESERNAHPEKPKTIRFSTHMTWPSEDFAPIEKAFDALFRAKGMIA